MKIFYIMPLSLILLLSTEPSTGACNFSVSEELEGCESSNIFEKDRKDTFKIREVVEPKNQHINITRELKSVNVKHKGKELTIVRNISNNKKSCPPFCIEPMNIKGVKTLGELETLEFIKNLNDKGNSIVLDIRENKYYREGTIPGALNLPLDMLQADSKYFNDVISILGIKKVAKKWQFKEVHDLLIFDDGITDNKASKAIKSLLKLSYPSDKIFYYRGGFSSWKNLGLTSYPK